MFHKCWHDTPTLTNRKTKSRQTTESCGVRGHEAVSCAERVEAKDWESIYCVLLCDLNHFVLFCLSKPGSHPFFSASFSLSQQES